MKRHNSSETYFMKSWHSEFLNAGRTTNFAFVLVFSAAAEDVPPEIIQLELSRWVKRSTAGSMISFVAFISWIITFQVTKENFGPKWFVMSPDEEITTGW